MRGFRMGRPASPQSEPAGELVNYGASAGAQAGRVSSETGEVRVTSSSGASKGRKPQAYDLIPTHPLKLLAERYGVGSEKYERVNGLDNWRNGYEWSLSYAALQRHLNAFWSGEDIDAETGAPHLAAAAWHCFALMFWMNDPVLRERFDDRQDPIHPYVADAA